MIIQLLGTGAADGIPGFFEDNDVSRWAREHGGKDIRTRSAAIIDGNLKIDLPPDTFAQLNANRLSARDWSGLVFTHSHEDHLALSEIQYALFPFNEMEELGFTIYANETVSGLIQSKYPAWPMDVVTTHVHETFLHGPYRITPVRANHKNEEECHNLIVQSNDRTILYGTDTGIWSDETFEFLKQFPLDVLVIEATDGFVPSGYYGHLSLDQLVEVVEQLRRQGTLHQNSRVVTTHHAHKGGARHCDLEAFLVPKGMEPGYDGMIIEV
jgi:phosphoribosyl 1,2-cyclic phosphate phosphodiesterase